MLRFGLSPSNDTIRVVKQQFNFLYIIYFEEYTKNKNKKYAEFVEFILRPYQNNSIRWCDFSKSAFQRIQNQKKKKKIKTDLIISDDIPYRTTTQWRNHRPSFHDLLFICTNIFFRIDNYYYR